jgi:hypothetical protein
MAACRIAAWPVLVHSGGLSLCTTASHVTVSPASDSATTSRASGQRSPCWARKKMPKKATIASVLHDQLCSRRASRLVTNPSACKR